MADHKSFTTSRPVPGLTLYYATRVEEGEECETGVIVHGRVTIAAGDKDEFARRLAEIVEQYSL